MTANRPQRAPMLTVQDVATELNASVEHIRRFIRRGELAAVNIATSGRPNYRVSRQALDEYLSAHAVAS